MAFSESVRFYRIPFEKKEAEGNIFSIGLADLKESFLYMKQEQPLIMQFSLAVAAINMILSALMIIGLPILYCHGVGCASGICNEKPFARLAELITK